MRSKTKKTAAPRHAVAHLENLEDRQYRTADHPIGINVNDGSRAAFEIAVPQLKKLGVDSVRLWYGIDNWSDRKLEGGLQRAIDYHNAGFDVTMTIAIDDAKVPNTSEVKDWFQWAAGNDALKAAVDRWEVGNEVDSSNYFKGTLKQYVSNFLKPASEALHAEGEKVVSAGVSWNPQDVQKMIDYGMLDMVDAVGFHPYARGVGLQKQRIAEINAVVDGRKPIVATEWNVRGYENNKTNWATAVDDAYGQVRSGFDLDYYFCLFVNDSMAGPAGLMSKKGVIQSSFYNGFLAASRGVGSTPPVVSNPGIPNTNGNAPSATDTQIALYDAKTDRVISGYSNLKADQVIDLADLPSDDLSIVAIPAKHAESVKMTLNGETAIESSRPYALFGDNDGDLNGRKLAAGSYSLSVTPYSKNNASGINYATRSIKFKLVDSRVTTPTTPSQPTGPTPDVDSDSKPEVTRFALVDAKTGSVIKGYGNLTADTIVSVAKLPTRALALLAYGDDDVKSLRLTANGVSHNENTLPYAFYGDNHGKLGTWKPTRGTYNVSAVAYGAKNAKGAAGSSLSITLKFV